MLRHNRHTGSTSYIHYIRCMTEALLPLLRCPVTRSELRMQVIATGSRLYKGVDTPVIVTGILYSDQEWCYPVVDGIPRLIVEAFFDYEDFFRQYLPGYNERRQLLQAKHGGLLARVLKKNRRTKQSFEREWGLFNYQEDRTWDAGKEEMIARFLAETGETSASLQGKLIFDAGCGNGLLNQYLAEMGAVVLGMDLSRSIERAFAENQQTAALFIQGDVQFPPVAFRHFDIVHCSGVLIHTNNTELSFACLEPCVKPGGKLSTWLYHPRKDAIHRLILFTRRFTSRLPLKFQYHLYRFTVFPVSYIIKRLKGNKQSPREMMIDILDQFTPEFRWEHSHDEASAWFFKRGYQDVQVTVDTTFGFNITGLKKQPG